MTCFSSTLYGFLIQIGVAGDEAGAFEHTAEILLAGMLMLPGAAPEALEGLIADFQPLQMHDADKFLAASPNLPLSELHASTLDFQTTAGEC